MASHIFVVYNTVESRIEQVVFDNTNYSDPSFNPPDCVLVHIAPGDYESTSDLLALVQSRLQ